MTPTEQELTQQITTSIVTEVINQPQSPHRQMMDKLSVLLAEHFKDTTKDQDDLPQGLNFQLKNKLLEQLNSTADELLTRSKLTERLHNSMRQTLNPILLTKGRETAQRIADAAMKNLRTYAQARLFFIPKPEYEADDLTEKYESAKRVTLLEHILQNNDLDVAAFNHALRQSTEWEGKRLVEQRTSRFLEQLANTFTL